VRKELTGLRKKTWVGKKTSESGKGAKKITNQWTIPMEYQADLITIEKQEGERTPEKDLFGGKRRWGWGTAHGSNLLT